MFKKSFRKAYLLIIVSLASAAIACWYGLTSARDQGNLHLASLFAEMCALLSAASILCVVVPLASRISTRENQQKRYRPLCDQVNSFPYTARHSGKDKLIALLFALFSAFLFILFLTKRPSVLVEIVCLSGTIVFAYLAYRYFLMTISFTDKEIEVKLFPFIHYFERYSKVTAVLAKRGNLQLHFLDGRVLSIWRGLGDLEKIVSILEERVKVTPKLG